MIEKTKKVFLDNDGEEHIWKIDALKADVTMVINDIMAKSCDYGESGDFHDDNFINLLLDNWDEVETAVKEYKEEEKKVKNYLPS